MSQNLTIRKGLDIKIAGGLTDLSPVDAPLSASVAVSPDDFIGFVPKSAVKEGDTVKAGDPLLFDKRDNLMKLVAPVAGKVTAIVRGERRKILRVVIEPDHSGDAAIFDTKVNNADDARRLLKISGLWALMRRRPFDIVPNPDIVPRDIFVSALDSHFRFGARLSSTCREPSPFLCRRRCSRSGCGLAISHH